VEREEEIHFQTEELASIFGICNCNCMYNDLYFRQTTKAAQLSQVQQQSTASPLLVSSTAASLLAQKQPLTPQTPATPAEASPLLREESNSDLQIVDEHGQPVELQLHIPNILANSSV
jgi:hypothetical protein